MTRPAFHSPSGLLHQMRSSRSRTTRRAKCSGTHCDCVIVAAGDSK
nr:hypothetical protein HEP84_54460 [Streptomyces sp. RLB1-33]